MTLPCRSIAASCPQEIEPEYPDSFSDALAAVEAKLPADQQLQLDGM